GSLSQVASFSIAALYSLHSGGTSAEALPVATGAGLSCFLLQPVIASAIAADSINFCIYGSMTRYVAIPLHVSVKYSAPAAIVSSACGQPYVSSSVAMATGAPPAFGTDHTALSRTK